MDAEQRTRDNVVNLCVLHGERREMPEAEVLVGLLEPLRQALADLPLDSAWHLPLARFERILQDETGRRDG